MPRRSVDLVAVMILTTVAVVLALLGLRSGIVPLVLGLPLALFLPGYALTALFAPGRFNRAARLLLSVGFSLGLTGIGRLLLSSTPWGLQLSSWAVLLGGVTLLAAIVALFRHHAEPRQAPARRPRGLHPLVVFGLVGAAITVIVAARNGAMQPSSAAFAQFWLAPTAQASSNTTLLQEALGAARPASVPTTTATASPTPAATPTATASPTPTPAPAATATAAPTPAPTAVPASSLTPQASDTLVAERLNIALSDWPTRETDTASLRYEDEQYRLTLNGQPSVSVRSVIPADNYRLSIDVAIDEGEAGVVFLAADPARFYRIMFNMEGAYTIQELQQNSDQASPIQDWTSSTALQSPEKIGVRIERQGDTVAFFANEQPLTTFGVPSGQTTNQVGVALDAASGQGQATFTALVVEQVSRQ